MLPVFLGIVVLTTVVLVLMLDPEMKRCEHCHGPITLRELWSHLKKCPDGPKAKGKQA